MHGQDLSLSGARLHVPLSHSQQWDQVRRVRRVHVNFAFAPSIPMSLASPVEGARKKKLGERTQAELGLCFGELGMAENEQVNMFITRQILSRTSLD